MRSKDFRPKAALLAILMAGAGLLSSTTYAASDTLRDRIRQRMDQRAAENPESLPPGFPAKGDLATATAVTLDFDGLHRRYLIQAPSGNGPFPVVILLHGGTQNAEHIWRQTSFPTLARRDGFILVAPDGINGHWNDGRGSTLGGGVSTADDVGFLSAVIADVLRSSHGDANAVFMTGVSNGGLMTMRFACERADLLHAAGNVISDLPVALRASCRPAKALPWISINGTGDPLMPYQGAPAGNDRRGQPQPALSSADDTFDFWARNARCRSGASTEALPDLDSNDQSTVERRVREGCVGNTRSQQYVMVGAGHVAPGLPIRSRLIQAVVGNTNLDIDMGTVIWQQFASTLRRR